MASNKPDQSHSDQLASAKQALDKLPILGPALWLYARDERKKYMFIGDQDWLLMPPVVLDQCRLYKHEGIPWAFFTWANVSDEVDTRLRSAVPKIAPHEWQSGTNLWIIDMVAPFGGVDKLLLDLRKNYLAGRAARALVPQTDGRVVVEDLPALKAAN